MAEGKERVTFEGEGLWMKTRGLGLSLMAGVYD